MTALASVMNRHAVALAADSAVTISNQYGHKVINSANKLFTISKRHPVGVMFCGNCNFNDTPWEVVVKLYRDNLKDKSFSTVKDYRNDFLKYLVDKHFFNGEKNQKIRMNIEMLKFSSIIHNITNEAIKGDKAKYNAEFLNQLQIIINDKAETCEGLSKFKEKDFNDYCNDLYLSFFAQNAALFPTDKDKIFFKTAFANFVRKFNSNIEKSQLIFVGFGEDEIYPALSAVDIYFGFNNMLRFHPYLEQAVTDDNNAGIARFGQTDVINTIINGINPYIRNSVSDIFHEFAANLKTVFSRATKDAPTKAAIDAIDTNHLADTFDARLNLIIQDNFTSPLIGSIDSLDKEDMAELVESMVSLTHLNRRITTSEEGVGGPIDVAIISKGDGFIWKKRKHYFDPKLNPSFFENYYK